MKIALGQINTTVGDFAGNAAKIVDFARRGREAGAELVIFHELSLCGYPPRDLVERAGFVERNREELDRLASETGPLGVRIVCGFVGHSGGDTGRSATNSAAVLFSGRVEFLQTKMLLPNYDVFDEVRHFSPAERQSVLCIGDRCVALTICEDVWNDKNFWAKRLYPRDPVEELSAQGANFLVNISASPYCAGKPALRLRMLQAIARRYNMPIVAVNQVGGNDSLVFDGYSTVIDAAGMVRARARAFEEDLVLYDSGTNCGEIHEAPADEPDEVYRALVLGTRDYVRKCGFRRALIGLSGGIDSSLTACVAVEALGAENVTGVAMPGPYSSQHSFDDARSLAQALGIRFETVPITEVWNAHRAALAEVFRDRAEDVTEENLQARIRGNTLMAMSNKLCALVLSTGNKSELAVGYSTLYGDMAGGLAVIADIPKTMVYELSRVANRVEHCRGAIPENVFAKAPSAELRPDQKDSDTLPPYEVLDAVLRAYIEEFQSPQQIAEAKGLPIALVREICRKVDQNEYKRQQAAQGLKVTSKAFGIGRRFPIAQKYSE